VAGHAGGALSRDDVKALGGVLDQGDAGLVVVYPPEMADRVSTSVTAASGKVHATAGITGEQLAAMYVQRWRSARRPATPDPRHTPNSSLRVSSPYRTRKSTARTAIAQSGKTNMTKTVQHGAEAGDRHASQSPQALRCRSSTPVMSCTIPTSSQNQPQPVRSIP
jgi:hypothetical protein